MDFTIQKVMCYCLPLCLALTSITHAESLKECSKGNILVAKKQVGTAFYWAENCHSNWQGQNMAVEFYYTEHIPEWAFKRAANYFLNTNIQDEGIRRKLTEITSLYHSVKPGDRYRLNYTHHKWTLQLELNGNKLGQIQHSFAQQYFSIWFGKYPFSLPLKQQLLKSS